MEDLTVKDWLFDFIGGGISGSAGIIVGQPFDTIKVRIQTQPELYTNPIECMKASIAEEGFASLFRGMAPPLATAAIINAVIFSSYGLTIRYLSRNKDPSLPPSYLDIFTAGAVAGGIQTVVLCPTDHIKCKLQVQHDFSTYKGPMDVIRKVIRQRGVLGLFQGFNVSLYREVPSFGMYFLTYEYFKDLFHKQWRKSFELSCFLAGGLSGVITWSMSYPIDLIKSRIQTLELPPIASSSTSSSTLSSAFKVHPSHFYSPKTSFFATLQNIMKDPTIPSKRTFLFRGLGTTLLRAFPVNGVIFPVYEVVVYFLNKFV